MTIIDPQSVEAGEGDGALVLLSGGQDSTTCLHWALKHWGRGHVQAVSFDYGQRHAVELQAAERIAGEAGVPWTLLEVPALDTIGGAALTDSNVAVNVDAAGTGNRYAEDHGLPSTFVPGRNAILLSTAAALAAREGLWTIVTGVCEADDAGYPDCRSLFLSAQEEALRQALDDFRLTLAAPLMVLSKGETFALAKELGVLDLIVEGTHTCYEGDRSVRWGWGYGCGKCGACRTRAAGWKEYRDAGGLGAEVAH